MIIEYAALPSKLVIFTADASGVEATAVACDHAAVERDVQAFLSALRADDRPAARRLGRELHARLVEPVQARIAGASRVAFVADGGLVALPFGALTNRDGAVLLESHEVVAAPSASIFVAAERGRARRAPDRVLIVTRAEAGAGLPRLPFVEKEADRIARAYKSATRLADKDARVEDIARLAPAHAAVHFGGHAVGDQAGFEPASILLADGNGGEHRLSVPQIAKLPLRDVSVVVLAGCGTAVGERRSREGAISVTHGFLAAGAPSVIATLWPIDDRAAAEFFPRVHAHLARGASPAEALRAVQLEYVRNPQASTALWAAVQVFGN